MEQIKKWMNKIVNAKIKKEQMLLMILAGVLIVLIALPTTDKRKEDSETTSTGLSNYKVLDTKYETEVEKRLEKSLSNVEGVGKVSVMVTIKTSAEKVVEKDTDRVNQSTEEQDQEGTTRITTDSEENKMTVYEEKDNGQVPYISKENSPKLGGVLVVAEGGDNAIVIQNITEAVQALFDVDTHKIKVMKMNS